MKGILVILFMAVSCTSAWAQTTTQITGTVHDQSGAVLPGVEVTATQTGTGISRSAVTNETGAYVLPNLAVGPYRFEATLPGFRTYVQTGIVLEVNTQPVINPVLTVGQVSEQVEVQANATLVETRSTAVGEVIENQRILELPLNGRNVTDLITLSNGAVQIATANHGTYQEGVLISIAGGQNFGVMYSLDGAAHNDPYQGAQMPLPFPDALQEFKVEASGMSASGGTRGSGGRVNAVTKSGTNEFHGDLFEFVRNYQFNARNFFATQRDSLKRNQYGGTLGGPISKNNLFFFLGYQGTKTRSDGTPTITFVPTASMLAGDFTAFASPACNAGRQITLKAPFVNNAVNPSAFTKAALGLASRLPTTADPCGRIIYTAPDRPDENKGVWKVDYQQSPKHSLFWRSVMASYYDPPPYAVTNNLLTSNGGDGFDNLAQSHAIGSTYLIDPNTINAFRLSVNRVGVHRLSKVTYSPQDLGVNAYAAAGENMYVQVTGGFTIGQNSGAGRFASTAYQIGDDLNFIRGSHQMTFGMNAAHWRTSSRAQNPGSYTFNGSAIGLGMADFLTGALTTLAQGTPGKWSSRQTYIAVYLSDVWKIRPRLTISYGLRWEPYFPLFLTEGNVYNYSDVRFHAGIHSTVYPNAPAGLYFIGDPGFPQHGATNGNMKYVAPRLGLAWDPQGDGRTSVRASYGIAYDFSGSVTLGGSAQAPPYGFNTTVQSPAGGFANPWSNFPGGNPFPVVFNKNTPVFPLLSSFYSMSSFNMAEPTIQSWNLSLERQIPGEFLISATYLGSQTTHLWVMGNVNRGVFFPGAPVNGVCSNGNYTLRTTGSACSTTANTDQRRRLALDDPQNGGYYSNLATREDGGTQHYNALMLSIQRRSAKGVNVSANYTLSHCLGNLGDALMNSPGDAGYLDPNNRNFDRGNCDSDRRQIFNLTSVAATPQFSNRTLRMVGTGWRLGTILRAQTGSFMTLLTGQDRVLSGASKNQRPNQILGNPYGDRSSLTRYLNPTAFAQPDLGTLGNMRPRNIQGPGLWGLDMALSRNFQVREKQNMEFRAEAFNVTNSLVRLNPNLTLSSNTFGQITSAGPARVMQFALKYAF
jgi:hypothetical protein